MEDLLVLTIVQPKARVCSTCRGVIIALGDDGNEMVNAPAELLMYACPLKTPPSKSSGFLIYSKEAFTTGVACKCKWMVQARDAWLACTSGEKVSVSRSWCRRLASMLLLHLCSNHIVAACS